MLPSPPRWKEEEVQVEGGNTKEPMILFYYDALECFKFIFANLLFLNHIDYVPYHEYANKDKKEQLYNEIMTGDRAW